MFERWIRLIRLLASKGADDDEGVRVVDAAEQEVDGPYVLVHEVPGLAFHRGGKIGGCDEPGENYCPGLQMGPDSGVLEAIERWLERF